MAFVGCSVVPGLSTLLCASLQRWIPKIDKTFICISPGTRHPRGPGSFGCLLSTIGREIHIPADGSARIVIGWSEPEEVEFPPPMGHRSVYFVVDIPDYFLQSLYFRTTTVEFKIGSELQFLNHLLTLVRFATKKFGLSLNRAFVAIARPVIGAASPLGTSRGGVIVKVTGHDAAGIARERSLCAYAAEHGEVIPAILPSLAAQMILSGETDRRGIVSHVGWVSTERLTRELQLRGVQMAVRGTGAQQWSPFEIEKAG